MDGMGYFFLWKSEVIQKSPTNTAPARRCHSMEIVMLLPSPSARVKSVVFSWRTEIPTFPESQWSYVSSPTWLVKYVYGKCRWKYIPYIESLGLENMSVHVTKTPPEKLTYSSSTWKEAGPKRTCHLPTIRTVSFRVPGIRIFCQRDVFFKLRVLRTSCWTL